MFVIYRVELLVTDGGTGRLSVTPTDSKFILRNKRKPKNN